MTVKISVLACEIEVPRNGLDYTKVEVTLRSSAFEAVDAEQAVTLGERGGTDQIASKSL